MKKKERNKITVSDFPQRKALYPLRCGLKVYAIIWEDRTFISGTIVSTYSMAELDQPGAEHFYNIEIANGLVYEVINEEDVFLDKKELSETIVAHITASEEVE